MLASMGSHGAGPHPWAPRTPSGVPMISACENDMVNIDQQGHLSNHSCWSWQYFECWSNHSCWSIFQMLINQYWQTTVVQQKLMQLFDNYWQTRTNYWQYWLLTSNKQFKQSAVILWLSILIDQHSLPSRTWGGVIQLLCATPPHPGHLGIHQH